MKEKKIPFDEEVIRLTKSISNDQDLGKAIRKLVNPLSKPKEKTCRTKTNKNNLYWVPTRRKEHLG